MKATLGSAGTLPLSFPVAKTSPAICVHSVSPAPHVIRAIPPICYKLATREFPRMPRGLACSRHPSHGDVVQTGTQWQSGWPVAGKMDSFNKHCGGRTPPQGLWRLIALPGKTCLWHQLRAEPMLIHLPFRRPNRSLLLGGAVRAGCYFSAAN